MRSFEVIRVLSGSWCIKGTGESVPRVDSPVPLMPHDPDRSWISDPNSDHPKGTDPKSFKGPLILSMLQSFCCGLIIYVMWSKDKIIDSV